MEAASFKYLLAGLSLCVFRKSANRPCWIRFLLKDFFLTRGTLWRTSVCKQTVRRRKRN